MKIAATMLFLLAFAFILSEAETTSMQLKPRVSETFTVNYIQNLVNCSYLVVVKTSCDSSSYTGDQISLAFGDAYGNQVYAPRLDDPFTNRFKRCASDAFQIEGPCTKDPCYVYLHRTGPDGWEPESVKIYAPDSSPVTYYFNSSIPNESWYGLNLCHGPFTPSFPLPPPSFPFTPSFPLPPPSFPFTAPPPHSPFPFTPPSSPPRPFPFTAPPPSFPFTAPPPPSPFPFTPPSSPPRPFPFTNPPPFPFTAPPPFPFTAPPPPPPFPFTPPSSPPPPPFPFTPPSSPPPPLPKSPPPPSFPFPPPPPSSSHQHRVPRWFVFVILGFVTNALF